MKFRKLLSTLTGCDDVRVLKAFIHITRSNQVNQDPRLPPSIKDRLRFVAISFLFPFIVRIRWAPSRAVEDIILEPSNDPRLVQAYAYFIKKNAGVDAQHYHWKQGVFMRRPGDVWIVLRAWIRIVLISLSVMFVRHNLQLVELWKFNIFMIQMALDKPRHVYVVDYTSVVSYLLVVSLRKLAKVYYIPTNSNLDAYMRYGYFEDVHIVVTSPLLAEQLDYFEERGWIKLVNTTVERWGSLFSIYHDQLQQEPRFDVGFFSSGEWARTKGMFNVYTRDEVLENMKQSNEFWELSELVISQLLSFVARHNLTFKVFLHPYERFLINEYGIYPPYAKYVDNKNVFMSEDLESGISNFFEARVGITTVSSIVYDRAAYGLETLFYVPDPNSSKFHDRFYYNRNHIKSMARNAFENMRELEQSLESLFSSSSN